MATNNDSGSVQASKADLDVIHIEWFNCIFKSFSVFECLEIIFQVAPASYMMMNPEQLAAYTRQQQAEAEMFDKFWAEKAAEVDQGGTDPSEFKSQQLPLARIKKIMKSDEDVRMISAEAPVLFAKACELFIAELTKRSWMAAQENSRRTVQRSDVAAAVQTTEIFDFLVDVVPKEEAADGGAVAGGAAVPSTSTAAAMGGGIAMPPGMYQMPGYPPMMMNPQQLAGMMYGQMPGFQVGEVPKEEDGGTDK